MTFNVSKLIKSMTILALIITAFFQMTLCILFYFNPDDWMQIGILLLVSFGPYILTYFERKKIFSKVHITAAGIACTCFGCKKIFIGWNECAEIGIGKLQKNYGFAKQWIYFSKSSVETNAAFNLVKIKLSEKQIKMQYSEAAFNEILKYVDENRIKNFQKFRFEKMKT